MKRRAFVAGMATVMAAPRCGYGQSMPRVGLISSVAPLAELKRNLYFGVFTERLEELGWREGTNVVVERRTTEGRSERLMQSSPNSSISGWMCWSWYHRRAQLRPANGRGTRQS